MAEKWSQCKNCGRSFKEDDMWGMGYCSDRCKREYYANNPKAKENDEFVRKWMLRLVIFFGIIALICWLSGC